jgi:hypothetical protein
MQKLSSKLLIRSHLIRRSKICSQFKMLPIFTHSSNIIPTSVPTSRCPQAFKYWDVRHTSLFLSLWQYKFN